MYSEGFRGLGASRAVADALAKSGIKTPFPVQRLVVPDALEGRDVLVKSPTGSGKTLAFAVPIVERLEPGDPRPSALVLAPTRELAGQILEQMRPLADARGALGRRRLRRRGHRAPEQAGPPRPRPGRDAGPARGPDGPRGPSRSAGARSWCSTRRTACSTWASARLSTASRSIPRERQTLFFSATLDGTVGRVAHEYTRNARSHEHAAPRNGVATCTIASSPSKREAKFDALVSELHDRDRGLTLVFVRTKRGADRLVKRLRAHDIEALAMHGNKSQGAA